MNQSLTISQARSRLPHLTKSLSRNPAGDAVAITRKGKPVLAVMSWDLYESIVETLEILEDKAQMAALRQGIKEAKAGKGIPWNEAKRSLG